MRHKQRAGKRYLGILFVVAAYFLISSFYISSTQKGSKYAFFFYTNDTVRINVDVLFGADSIINGYKALVETPICEDTVCYAVRLYFFWDVLGNFQKYELIPGMPLTKQKHKPFTSHDHEILLGLLKKTNPVIAGLNKNDLIAKKKEDEVDGYSGATISAVKNEVVPGAVYSCYTLWHIANACVKDSIQSYTSDFLSPILVSRITMLESAEVPYFLINNFTPDDFLLYKNEVLEMLKNGEGYFAKEAFNIMPDKLIAKQGFQDSLAGIYSTLDYFAQRRLLERLENNFTSNELAMVLVESLEGRNSSQNRLILNLFCNNSENLEVTTLQYFLQQLRIKQVALSKDEYQKVISLNRSNKDLKEDVKLFKKNFRN